MIYTSKSSTINNLKPEKNSLFSSPQKVSLLEKQPSKLGILLLAFLTIMLYGFGINQLSSVVVHTINAAVQQTTIDY